MPIVRAPVLASTTSQQSTAAAQITEVNSYMLPSGSRPVASPRATIDSRLAANPTTVTTTAARPNRSPHGHDAAGWQARRSGRCPQHQAAGPGQRRGAARAIATRRPPTDDLIGGDVTAAPGGEFDRVADQRDDIPGQGRLEGEIGDPCPGLVHVPSPIPARADGAVSLMIRVRLSAAPADRPAWRIPRRILPGPCGQDRRPAPRYGPADRGAHVSSSSDRPPAPVARSRNHTRRRLNTSDTIRPTSNVTAKISAHTCAGSYEVCSDTHSL